MRADFACLSKRCATEEGATVYELPVGSTRCPVCGSKRLRQLFNNPNVIARGAAPERDLRLSSSSHLIRSTALLQPESDHADSIRPKKDMGTFAMRTSGVDDMSAVAALGKGRPMSQIEVMRTVHEDRRAYGAPTRLPSVLHTLNRVPIPTTRVVHAG